MLPVRRQKKFVSFSARFFFRLFLLQPSSSSHTTAVVGASLPNRRRCNAFARRKRPVTESSGGEGEEEHDSILPEQIHGEGLLTRRRPEVSREENVAGRHPYDPPTGQPSSQQTEAMAWPRSTAAATCRRRHWHNGTKNIVCRKKVEREEKYTYTR